MSKQFVKIEKVKEGTKLVPDGGFTCMDEGVVKEVVKDEDGHLYIPCRDGMHYLEGQIDEDFGEYVGLYPAA